jgi:hypothetical protein
MLEIEKEKSQRTLAIKEAELQLKQKQMIMDNELAVRKAADDFTLRRMAIVAQYHVDYTEQQFEQDASAQDRWLEAQGNAHSQALAMHQQAFDQQQAAEDQAFQQQQQANQPQTSEGQPQ